jgi:hypothetical protein
MGDDRNWKVLYKEIYAHIPTVLYCGYSGLLCRLLHPSVSVHKADRVLAFLDLNTRYGLFNIFLPHRIFLYFGQSDWSALFTLFFL